MKISVKTGKVGDLEYYKHLERFAAQVEVKQVAQSLNGMTIVHTFLYESKERSTDTENENAAETE